MQTLKFNVCSLYSWSVYSWSQHKLHKQTRQAKMETDKGRQTSWKEWSSGGERGGGGGGGDWDSQIEKGRQTNRKEGETDRRNVRQTQRHCLLVGCLTSQQHASVSQGRICSDNCTCCHTEIEVADQTFQLTQSEYTDTRPTSPSTDPITPSAWQGSQWSANF